MEEVAAELDASGVGHGRELGRGARPRAGEGTRPRRILGRGSTAASWGGELGRRAGEGSGGSWGGEMGGVAGAAGGGGRRTGDGGGERMGAMEKMGGWLGAGAGAGAT